MLILSRHTGAACQLGAAALLTDPRSAQDLVDTLRRALTMSPGERAAHLAHLATLLDDPPPLRWAQEIIAAIRRPAVTTQPDQAGAVVH